jgi:hypothetical protein
MDRLSALITMASGFSSRVSSRFEEWAKVCSGSDGNREVMLDDGPGGG